MKILFCTSLSSTADETPLIPDLHTGILPILRHGSELGSLHAPAGRSTEAEARGLPYALSVYELVRFCQKRRSIEVTNLPSVQDIITKRRNSITVRSCGETCDHTPAHHRALSQVAAIRTGSCLYSGWTSAVYAIR